MLEEHVHVRVQPGRNGPSRVADEEARARQDHRVVLLGEVAAVQDRPVELSDDVDQRHDGNVHPDPEPQPVGHADVVVVAPGELVGHDPGQDALGGREAPLPVRTARLDVIEIRVHLVLLDRRLGDRDVSRAPDRHAERRVRLGEEVVLGPDPDLASLVGQKMAADLDAVDRAPGPAASALEPLLPGAGEGGPVFGQADPQGPFERPMTVEASADLGIRESQVACDQLFLPAVKSEGPMARLRGVRGRHREEADVPLVVGSQLRGSGRSDQTHEQAEERRTLNLHAISFRKGPEPRMPNRISQKRAFTKQLSRSRRP